MNILITGKDSYIGLHIKEYLESYGHSVYEVDTISDEWKNTDYTLYDSVIHVAAIVHDNSKTASNELFRKVNTELPYEIATLAKKMVLNNLFSLVLWRFIALAKHWMKTDVL